MNAASVGVILAWLPAVGFALTFPKRGRKLWSEPVARSTEILAIVIAAVLTLAMLRRVLGFDLPAWVIALVYLFIAGALWHQQITLLIARSRRPAALPIARSDTDGGPL